VSLAPKAPWVGPAGAFEIGRNKWENANVKSWPFLEYDPEAVAKAGGAAPQRQHFTGVPAGAMSEAAAALDDIKNIVGIHDASLGIPGDEISGKAIRYRQHEGDTSTFDKIDNQHRALRCVGRILVEQIPNVYGSRQIVRIIGDDGAPQMVALARKTPPAPGMPPALPAPPPGFTKVYDITEGKYDVRIEAGPSYTTRREETADLLTDYLKAAPQAAPILGPVLVKLSDIPDGEKISAMLATTMPPAARQIWDGTPPPAQGAPPPEVAAKQAQLQAELQMKQQDHAAGLQMQREKAALDMQLKRESAALDLQITREKAAADLQVMRDRAEAQKQIEAMKLAADVVREPGPSGLHVNAAQVPA
jgi:hypothetical protein